MTNDHNHPDGYGCIVCAEARGWARYPWEKLQQQNRRQVSMLRLITQAAELYEKLHRRNAPEAVDANILWQDLETHAQASRQEGETQAAKKDTQTTDSEG